MRIRRFLRDILKLRRAGSGIDLTEPWKIPQGPVTPEDVFYCFRLLLGRPPNREEWEGHLGQASSDLDALVRSYMSSLEGSRRAASLLSHRLDDHVSLASLKGFSIYVQDEDASVGQHVKRDAYEPHITALFRDRLRPGMHVLDIGANIGYYTMLSASLVAPAGSVTAIEPNPISAKLLEASRRANSFDNVTVLQVAAGRTLGLLVLHGSYGNVMTSAAPGEAAALMNSTTVPSFRVDDLIPRNKNIDFVKIDVEGAEYNALLGASELIKRCHPTIVSEFSPSTMPGISGVDGRGYLRFLIEFGYKMSVIEGGGTLRACGTEPEKVMDAFTSRGVDHIDILLEPTPR
jgi:FkbM family methyltransferase